MPSIMILHFDNLMSCQLHYIQTVPRVSIYTRSLCTARSHKPGSIVLTNAFCFISTRGHDLSRATLYTLVNVNARARDKVICRSSAGKTRSSWQRSTRVLFFCARQIRGHPPCSTLPPSASLILLLRRLHPPFSPRGNAFALVAQRRPGSSVFLLFMFQRCCSN